MTGGAWKDTPILAGPKRKKAKKQPGPISTAEHAISPQDEDAKFQTEVDHADLRLKLRRWRFGRSWRTAASNSLPDEAAPISPRTRVPPLPPLKDVVEETSCSEGKLSLPAGGQAKEEDRSQHEALPACNGVNIAIAQPDPPLDRKTVGQYLDQCIAAAESQLVGAGSKSRKKGAVKEIERLVEKVIATQADCS